MIGSEVSAAAESTLNDVRGAINKATRPAYDAAGQTLVPHQVHAAMRADPLFVDALDAVRKDPAKNSFIRAHSDRSVAVYDAVKQELRERSASASNPVSQNHSQAVSSATGTLAGDVKRIAIASDRSAAGGPHAASAYEEALQQQTAMRKKYLEPLQRGPIGRLAKHSETEAAINALFPRSPLPGSAGEVSTAVSALSKRSPYAATQLVRAHVLKTLDESTANLQGGWNEYGPAQFAKDLVGNSQQGANMRAAVEALPNGKGVWEGVETLLEIAQATGKRQRKGSLTAFNDADLKSMSSGGAFSGATKLGLSPGKWWSAVNDKWSAWQAGQHLTDVASIVTDPKSALLLRKLSKVPVGSREAQILASRITAQEISSSGEQSRNSKRQ